ncbi:AAA family ATPase [Maridesulfovibrio hydrothermalis]|uniref:ATPase n=1 Tax=Maridesulfovibrio hydrothermalis AM13 = DSM 14728 TaxID=1121451 RepID=L0RCG8_9BACT|nr:ATP-binding protein [Maridesulfovibrio hydrothermalis]CCO23276.1 ATPase [Maridesulfovibrio hydrothermalis AM13 = DSM 14728]
MKNPFHTDTLEPDQPFCNRVAELGELANHARNGMNVVIFAPRRYGKTSLVRRVQHQLRGEGICIIYAQFMRLVSVDDLVHRLAKGIISGLHEHESLLEKGKRWLGHFPSIQTSFTIDPVTGLPSVGVQMAKRQVDPIVALEGILEEIGKFLEKEEFQVCIALDEFQDIVDIKDARTESLLREHIQRHRASYFFLGSRRRVLLDIFNNRGRPFYQSATMMELDALPEEECVDFITSQFAQAGKQCPEEVALEIVQRVERYPYYLQALAYRAFEFCEKKCSTGDVSKAFESLIANERYGYQAIIQGISTGQLKLLRGIAEEEKASVTSSAFLQTYNLTLGGVQSARKFLSEQDLIEKAENGQWGIVDPMFREWMLHAF